MRLVAGALALTLFASFVRAEGTGSPGPGGPSPGAVRSKVPLRVVRVMPESHQALLFDRSRATHVLVEIGGKIDGYTVEDIDDDEVTLRIQGKQIVLAAPARGSERRTDQPPAGTRTRSAADARPADGRSTAGSADGSADGRPADTAASDPAPIDPYEPAVRVVQAPGSAGDSSGGSAGETAIPGEGGIRVVLAPSSSENPSAVSGSREASTGPRPIEPGDDGVRVVEAPGDAGARSTASPSNHKPAIRVAQAPRSTRASGARGAHVRASDAAVSDAPIRVVEAPGAGMPAASDSTPEVRGVDPRASNQPAAASTPGAGQAPSPGSAAVTTAVPNASTAPTAVQVPSPGSAAAISPASTPATAPAGNRDPSPGKPAAANRDPSPGKPAAANHDPSPSKAPLPSDQQSVSARAMADVLTGGNSAREGRKPRSSLFVAPSPDPAATAPSAPPADARPTTGSSAAAGTSGPAADTRPATATADARPAPATAAHAAPTDAVTLSRGEVDAALADFARLTAAIHGSFSASGVMVEAVSDGTLFQRAGLRAGDVIAAVDGVRLRSLDDAANLYARASTATAITAQIVRGGKPVTLHVTIR